MIQIEALHNEIRTCRRCLNEGYPISPPPLAHGAAPAKFMVIGQAPSISDQRSEQMYTGPAGRKLRNWLIEAGFSEPDFGTTIYLTALTKCFPGRLPGKSTDRAPSIAECLNCRSWLDKQIELVDPQVIVPFGKMSISTFLPAMPLTESIGKRWNREGRIILPLPHSSGASTWLNAPENQALLDDALAEIAKLRAELIDTAATEPPTISV